MLAIITTIIIRDVFSLPGYRGSSVPPPTHPPTHLIHHCRGRDRDRGSGSSGARQARTLRDTGSLLLLLLLPRPGSRCGSRCGCRCGSRCGSRCWSMLWTTIKDLATCIQHARQCHTQHARQCHTHSRAKHNNPTKSHPTPTDHGAAGAALPCLPSLMPCFALSIPPTQHCPAPPRPSLPPTQPCPTVRPRGRAWGC